MAVAVLALADEPGGPGDRVGDLDLVVAVETDVVAGAGNGAGPKMYL